MPLHHGSIRCFEALQSADPRPDEIIVVGDGAPESMVERARQYGFRTLVTPVQSGPAAARNLGARHAQGAVLCFVDDDVALSQNAIGLIREFFASASEDVAAVLGSYDEEASATNFASQYKNLLQHYVHQQAREEGFTFWTACGAIRRDVFLSLGGFQEHYRTPSIEDIAFGYRLRRAGYRIRVSRTLQCKHLKRWTLLSLFRSDFFRRALPWTDLILSAGRFDDDLNISAVNRWKVVIAYGLLLSCVLSASAFAWRASASILAVTLVILDRGLYRLFFRKRGMSFALRGILWHWFSYLYSGAAFCFGVVRFVAVRVTALNAHRVIGPEDKGPRAETS
jgi:GT2 family glycosyltransferase